MRNIYKFIYQDILKIASRDETIRILKIFCRVVLILLIYQNKSTFPIRHGN